MLIHLGILMVLDIFSILLNGYAIITSVINDEWLSFALSSLGLTIAMSVIPGLLRLYRRNV